MKQFLDYEGLKVYTQELLNKVPVLVDGVVPTNKLPAGLKTIVEFNGFEENLGYLISIEQVVPLDIRWFPSQKLFGAVANKTVYFNFIGHEEYQSDSGPYTDKLYVCKNVLYMYNGTDLIKVVNINSIDGLSEIINKVNENDTTVKSLPSNILTDIETKITDKQVEILFDVTTKGDGNVYTDATRSETIIPLATMEQAGIISPVDRMVLDHAVVSGTFTPVKKTVDSLPKSILTLDDDAFDQSKVDCSMSFIQYNKNDDGQYNAELHGTTLTMKAASSNQAGVMTASDKQKLDSVNLSKIMPSMVWFDKYVDTASVTYASIQIPSGGKKPNYVYVGNEHTFAIEYNGGYYCGSNPELDTISSIDSLAELDDGYLKRRPFKNTIYMSKDNYTMYISDNEQYNELHKINNNG